MGENSVSEDLSLSSLTGMLGRKPTDRKRCSTLRPEAAVPGPDEERALAAMRQEGPDETCVDCGKPRSFGSGRRCRACYLARAEAKRGEPVKEEASPDTCGCGRPKDHGGRCSYRRQTSPSLADDLAPERRKNNGRPRIEVDLQQLEDLLANPDLTMSEVGERLRMNRNTIYHRKEKEPDFRAAYERGLERREAACHAKSDGNITNSITSSGTGSGCGRCCDAQRCRGARERDRTVARRPDLGIL